MIEFSVKDIAGKVSGKVVGDDSFLVASFSAIDCAVNGDLSILMDESKQQIALASSASVLVVPESYEDSSKILIKVEKPRSVLPILAEMFSEKEVSWAGVHPSAVVHPTAIIGEGVNIGPFCVISEGAIVGDGTTMESHVNIGLNAKVGQRCLLYSGVKIYHKCSVGNDCIIHSGTVVGSDGFGFVPQQDKSWKKVKQIGIVIVEDNVEIGANTCIDRGALSDTVIGKGTKMDNLIHMAHNCKVDTDCAIAGQVGFAGSTNLGKNVQVAGQVGFVGHTTIGDNSVILAKSGVWNSQPANQVLSGFPARRHKEELRIKAVFPKMPKFLKEFSRLKKQLIKKGLIDEE